MARRRIPQKNAARALLLASACAASSGLYTAGYGYARISHRLVLVSSCGDPDQVALGAGALPVWKVLFARAIEIENTARALRALSRSLVRG